MKLPPRSGLTSDRDAARMPFRVVSPTGRILAGNHSEKGATKTARVIATPTFQVRVERRVRR